jgi:hypothetical protein
MENERRDGGRKDKRTRKVIHLAASHLAIGFVGQKFLGRQGAKGRFQGLRADFQWVRLGSNGFVGQGAYSSGG